MPVSGWREVEIYGTFIRLTGELEVIGAERLSDSINRFGAFLQVRNSRAEPLSTNYPVLSLSLIHIWDSQTRMTGTDSRAAR